MSKIYQGIIYFNNKPIYDIILKAVNQKIALWYLIRLYYESERKDLFETFLFVKIKNLLLEKDESSFSTSYTRFIYSNKTLLSILLFMMSNDLLTLTDILKWTTEFNTLYTDNNIIITERLIFDTNSRMFDKNIKLKDVNFHEICNPSYLQYKLQQDKKINKLIYRHKSFTSNKYLSDNKIETQINQKYIPPTASPSKFKSDNIPVSPLSSYLDSKTNSESVIDRYRNWSNTQLLAKYHRRSSLPYSTYFLTDKKKKK